MFISSDVATRKLKITCVAHIIILLHSLVWNMSLVKAEALSLLFSAVSLAPGTGPEWTSEPVSVWDLEESFQELEVMLEKVGTVVGPFGGRLHSVQMNKLRVEKSLKTCPKTARIHTKCTPNLCSIKTLSFPEAMQNCMKETRFGIFFKAYSPNTMNV